MPGLPSLLAALGIVGVVFALLSFLVMFFSGMPLQSDLGWVGGNLVLGSTGEARRAGKYGTSAVLSTVLGIAILGMLGFLGSRYHYRFDWSEGGVHTLSDQSLKVLEGLESDVSVTALVSTVDQAPVRELLDRYAYESERFQVDYADPNERPGLLDQLGVSAEALGQGGVLHIAIGGESVQVSEVDEQQVTGAMVKLTRTGEKVVYFVQGHGEAAVEGEAGAGRGGFALASDALRNENYRVASLLLASVPDVPEDADVVIVAGPQGSFFEAELEALDRYLARGGAVLALVDPRAEANLAAALAGWGVELGDDIVIDRALALFGRAVTPMAGRYDPDHAITRDMRDPRNDPVMFHEVRSTRSAADGAFSEIVATGEASWAERDLARLDGEGQAALDPEDLQGPVPVMVAGTPALADVAEDAEPRLVVVGDSNFASNEFLDAGRNRDLFLNATNWLMGDVEAISIRPNASRPSRFQLSAEQFHTIRSASLFILPEAIAVLGVFTWWSRRNPAG
jgi:ABC-type uncharacterized transport system involved in gliding motility auxiliary subunit